jgi:hypothetical protein
MLANSFNRDLANNLFTGTISTIYTGPLGSITGLGSLYGFFLVLLSSFPPLGSITGLVPFCFLLFSCPPSSSLYGSVLPIVLLSLPALPYRCHSPLYLSYHLPIHEKILHVLIFFFRNLSGNSWSYCPPDVPDTFTKLSYWYAL